MAMAMGFYQNPSVPWDAGLALFSLDILQVGEGEIWGIVGLLGLG